MSEAYSMPFAEGKLIIYIRRFDAVCRKRLKVESYFRLLGCGNGLYSMGKESLDLVALFLLLNPKGSVHSKIKTLHNLI